MSELERALERPDVGELRRVLAIYREWSGRPQEHDDFPDEAAFFVDPDLEDLDRGLALVVLASDTFDEPEFLGLVSAGLLENLLDAATDEFLARVLNEARRSPRFFWLLSGVWRNSMAPSHAAAVKSLVGDHGFHDPLPPRPTA